MKELTYKAAVRALEALMILTPGSEEYHRATGDADLLCWLWHNITNLDKPDETEPVATTEEAKVVPFAFPSTAVNKTEEEPAPTEPETVEVPEPVKEEPSTPAEPSMSKVEVIDILSKLSSEHEGLQINKIMRDMCGATKLSQVPPERYAELVRLAREAADAAD